MRQRAFSKVCSLKSFWSAMLFLKYTTYLSCQSFERYSTFQKKVCNLLCRHIFILMLMYNKIEDIFDKNIFFWWVKQAFVITHNCWRSIFENIMLTKLVMSYYLQIELFKYYQALFEYARSKSTSLKNMVTQTIFHNF